VTTFLLVRHATHDLVGKALAGRLPGVSINAVGVGEAAELATRLADARLSGIYSSPQPRARETARPLAARLGLGVEIEEGFDEIDFGQWTGRAFTALADDATWPVWVERRSLAQPPGGERFADVQRRAVAAIDRLRRAHPDKVIALFSHGDVIKAALAHVLGLSLDHLERFDIAPASVSVIAAGDGWAQVKLINGRGAVVA
jgi:probable phosphoglycerate mutase